MQEIRVTVRGAQCDALPVWSESYMGMMDGNGNWSHDYELSIDYTDNTYVEYGELGIPLNFKSPSDLLDDE